MADQMLDLAGVGIGPANLSLAALSAPIVSLSTRFFEKKCEFSWHPDLLFPGSRVQVSFLKDLVTPVDPTSKYSFLSFIVSHRRFYRFVTAAFPYVSRAEFNQYFSWVSKSLPGLEFDAPVDSIELGDDSFVLKSRGRAHRARNVVLGIGQTPYVPSFVEPHLCDTVLHANHFKRHNVQFSGRRVAVIGGGQAGAELVHHFMENSAALPEKLLWLSSRSNFLPLDDSPFTNELFTPEYSHYFYHLGDAERRALLEGQRMASDGVRQELLDEIYRLYYSIEFVERRPRVFRFMPRHSLVGLRKDSERWVIEIQPEGRQPFTEEVDYVILATGLRSRLPECLAPIQHLIHRRGDELALREDFTIEWDGPSSRKIYVQNGSRHRHGVADPNLSLLAWRSATIVNSLLGRPVYDCRALEPMLEWPPHAHAPCVTAP